MTDARKDDPADLLYGVAAIARHLQLSRKQVYHLHDKGDLPTFKVGATVCALRSSLAKHFRTQEAAAAEAARNA